MSRKSKEDLNLPLASWIEPKWFRIQEISSIKISTSRLRMAPIHSLLLKIKRGLRAHCRKTGPIQESKGVLQERREKKTKMALMRSTSMHTMKGFGKSCNRNFHGIRHQKSIRKDLKYGVGLTSMVMVYSHWLKLTKQ